MQNLLQKQQQNDNKIKIWSKKINSKKYINNTGFEFVLEYKSCWKNIWADQEVGFI